MTNPGDIIQGKQLSGIGDDWPKNPGEYCFLPDGNGRQHAAIAFMCPCGCGVEGCVELRPLADQRPSWEWNGNLEAPTLQPSIQRNIECRWHGYLEGGNWRTV